jgi:hypothetical protein
MNRYIHQLQHWPDFTWDSKALLPVLGHVRNLQGNLLGKMTALGVDLKQEALLETLTLDILKKETSGGRSTSYVLCD